MGDETILTLSSGETFFSKSKKNIMKISEVIYFHNKTKKEKVWLFRLQWYDRGGIYIEIYKYKTKQKAIDEREKLIKFVGEK